MLELKRALRNLLRRPLWTGAAVLTIGLGVGLATAAFSVVYGSILVHLPFPGGEELYRVSWLDREEGEPAPMRWQDFEVLRQASLDSVTGVAAWSGMGMALGLPGRGLERENGALVSGELFPLLDVRPRLGRWIGPAESRESVVVISHELWERTFARDPGVVGREIRVWHQQAVIVGVMPPGLRFPLNQDLWMPLEAFGEEGLGRRLPLQILARIPAGSSLPGARARLQGALADVEPPSESAAVHVEPFVAGYTREVRRPLWLLWLGALGLLLVGCLNAGQLIAARVVERSRELSIREALGAGGARRTWAVFAEVLLVATGGVVLGTPIALAAIALYQRFGGLVSSFWVDVGIHPPVVAFVGSAFLATTLLAAGIPWAVARRATGTDLLRSGTASPDRTLVRLAHLSVTLQVCLALVVLVATSLMGQSLRRFAERELVVEPERVVATWLNLWGAGRDDPEQRLELFRDVRRQLEELPGFASVALGTDLPGGSSSPVDAELESGRRISVRTARISPGYFAVLGHAVLRGRDFDARDDGQGTPVALVSATLARSFPGDVLGRRVRLAGKEEPGPWLTVIGVVPDLFLDWDPLEERMGSAPQPGLYLPLAQSPPVGVNVIARVRGDTGAALEEARGVLVASDPSALVSFPKTLDEHLAGTVDRQRQLAGLFGVLSAAALFLSSIGIGALVAFSVQRRGRELGVRRALGAPAGELLALVLTGAARDLVVGLVAGVGAAWLVTRVLRNLLFGIDPGALGPFALAAGALAAAAIVAAWLPAARAARIDPMTVLREE